MKKLQPILCLAMFSMLLYSCESQTIETDDEFNSHAISESIDSSHPYIQALKESPELQAHTDRAKSTNEPFTPIFNSSTLFTYTNDASQRILAVPVDNGKPDHFEFLYVYIHTGLDNSDGDLPRGVAAYFGKEKADLIENGTGTLLLPTVLEQQEIQNIGGETLYTETRITKMVDGSTLLHGRMFPDGTIQNLSQSYGKGCETWWMCLSETLEAFYEDMGWVVEMAAEATCGACVTSQFANQMACGACAALFGIPAAEFAIICGISPDLGFCEEE